MKRILIVTSLIIATSAITEASAQIHKQRCSVIKPIDPIDPTIPIPRRNYHPHWQAQPYISYDYTTKTLTVSLPSNSQDGRIEIIPSNSSKTTILIRPGDTVRYNLGNYGRSSFTVIVSSGNTVLFSQNIKN